MSTELFSWKKFISGVFDPIGYFKTLAGFLRVLLVAAILFLAYCIGVRIHDAITPKKPQPSVFTVNDQVGGTVKNSADQKKCNFGLLNF